MMNEKIQEIYNRAFAEYFGEEYKECKLDILPEDQYFAELIIKECMDLVIAHEDDAPKELDKLWHHMKEHFGVE
jgi:hypothetical protein